MKPFHGRSPCIDSAPMYVVILGVPFSIASISFPFIPAPNLMGAKTTLEFWTTIFASSARPLIRKPVLGLLSCNTFCVGYAPYIFNLASGSLLFISGQIVSFRY